ncbi:SKP1-like protein 1A [Spinacia oleracea]|uniref:SKP1-like protein 1A n=1 Tax=Spinacia oleracea TaxID=3562 RepID=A0A9R0ITJ8_SPIOL|nr:SKP1-like protein 1A [Spinacia oleracea]
MASSSSSSSSSSAASSKKVILKSSDNEEFIVDENVALQSELIKRSMEHNCGNNVIPVPNVTSAILVKVIEYCEMHIGYTTFKNCDVLNSIDAHPSVSNDDKLEMWDDEFVDVDQRTLLDLLMAAHYLEIKSLHRLTCQTVANAFQDNDPEVLRKILKIETDYTKKELAEIKKETKKLLKNDYTKREIAEMKRQNKLFLNNNYTKKEIAQMKKQNKLPPLPYTIKFE